MPGGFLYFDFPDTGGAALGIFIGDVILPNTPPAAMFAGWLAYGSQTWQTEPVVVILEPTAVASAGIGVVMMVGVVCRQSRQMVEI